jgi:hypothetical protein
MTTDGEDVVQVGRELTTRDADPELLELAREALGRAGYAVELNVDGIIPTVIAENLDNVVGLAATVTVEGALLAEPIISKLLVQRMSGRDLEGKRWDGYVALLSSQAAPASISSPLFGVAYNLRHVRRLVRVGVATTLAAVERALRPVLPLPMLPSADELTDPLATLGARLVEQGVAQEAVDEAFARFRLSQPSITTDDDLSTASTEDVP